MQEIDEKILSLAQKVAREKLVSTLGSISQIHDKGEVNKVYVITLSDSRKYILRINSDSELERFRKEKWCADVTQAKGVPGAKVINTGTRHGMAYTLLEYVDGKNGADIEVTLNLWQQLGVYLKMIHSISTSGFGEGLEDIQNGSRKTWEGYLKYNIDSLDGDDELIKRGLLDAAISGQLRILFEGLSKNEFKFGLNHGDYSLSNIIVSPEGAPHVIDWGSAQAHVVPHYDLSVITDESLEEDSEDFLSLLSGYGMSLEDYGLIRNDIKKLKLLESVDKLRWAIDQSQKSIDYYKRRLDMLLKENDIL